MANIPSNLSYGTVTGRFIVAYQDSADIGLEPDAIPASGSIFFTASPKLIKNITAEPDPVSILPAVVEATLDSEGYLCGYGTVRGIILVATDDPDGNPVDWTWRADFRLTDSTGASISVNPFSFELPGGTAVDLTVASPVADADGTFYIVGPQGPIGDGLQIDGVVATEEDLPETGLTNNDAYITQDNGHLWIWIDGAWSDTGPFVGPGVAAGGSTNAILVKLSGTDYDTAWTNTIDGGNA